MEEWAQLEINVGKLIRVAETAAAGERRVQGDSEKREGPVGKDGGSIGANAHLQGQEEAQCVSGVSWKASWLKSGASW
jgi:hypothetical protein